jgi:hypothetical protein
MFTGRVLLPGITDENQVAQIFNTLGVPSDEEWQAMEPTVNRPNKQVPNPYTFARVIL